jgi:hypothetical protein
MKKLILLLFILINLAVNVHGQGRWRPGEMEVRVSLLDPDDATTLSKLGLNGDIYNRQGYAILYVIGEELDLLVTSGFRVEILKNDLNNFYKDFWTHRDQYHSYEEIIAAIDSLHETFPSICKKIDYGLSVEGRELCALKISDYVNTDDPEPEVFLDGGVHGDEIGGPENLIRFAEFLCDNYDNDPYITDLIDTREIWLYIMVNPDGRVNMTRQNSNGVDLNRDYGYMWDGAGASPGYYSQPETRAARTCLLDNQFVVSTSYHSGAQYLAYTWSYRPDSCPDQAHVNYLAGIYSSASGYSGLEYGQGYTGMYAINGSSKDAAYGMTGAIGWTMEISYAKQPPVSQIQYFYELNEPAMLAVIEQAGYGIHGTITDAATGAPVTASIYINDFYPCYNDPVIGDYHKYVLAGNYSVKVVANGYQPVVQDVTVDPESSTELNFTLQPVYNHFARRVIACQVPITNFDDEGLTYASLWAPDNINYSLGYGGWIILDMQDEIFDGPGNELIVHEGDSEPESYSCYTSVNIDGPWQLAGNGTGTASFNFLTAGISQARYIRILDDGIGPVTGDNAGFDLDAIEAPEQPEVIFMVMDCHIDDQAGNNNSRIDPGETANLVVTLRSLGSVGVENGYAYLNYDGQNITIANPEAEFEILNYGDTADLVFSMGCSSFCQPGEIIMLALNVTSNDGAYQQCFPFNITAGPIVEDWETAGFTKFDWLNQGNKSWVIHFQDPYQGLYSARSGNIDDGEFSALEVTMDVIGYDDISFYRKVSSEANSDYLIFYIDNNPAGYWSGEMSWEKYTYQVSPGYHTFKWSFEKDNSNSAGSDGGWIDYIVFPSSNLDGTMKTLANALPHELCGGGESALAAYVVGGTGNFSFEWTPGELLDDPAAQFPVASVVESNIFTVVVNDGGNIASSSVNLQVFLLPDTPEIFQAGDSLVSQSTQGNQWYTMTGPVAGATGRVYYPETEDDYFVIVTGENGCLSDSSNIIAFEFTGVEENQDNETISVFPNPFSDEIIILSQFLLKGEVCIKVFDITGSEVYSERIEKVDYQLIIDLHLIKLKKGIYLILISGKEGNILSSKKIIKI